MTEDDTRHLHQHGEYETQILITAQARGVQGEAVVTQTGGKPEIIHRL